MAGDGERLRVAVIGYGLAGAVFHAPLVASDPGLRVAAIVTSSPARAADARRDHPGARVVPTADELWANAGRLDLVVVAAPNRAHVPLARAALAAGLPVVVDKPLAASAEEGRRLVLEAEDRGLLLTVFHNRRWDGDFLTVRRLVAEGALGDVVRMESRFERFRPEVDATRWRESADPADAGGLLADLGSHLVDQAITLLGPPARVFAEVDIRRPGAVVDDDCFVSLLHPGGARSHLRASMVAAAPAARFRVLGLRGGYEKHGLDGQEDALRDGKRPGPGWGEERDSAWGVLADGGSAHRVRTEPGAWPAFYAGVAAALRGEGPPPVDPWEAVRVLEVVDAARRSAAEGALVDLA
jgi:predicted dehydrogenase